MMVEMKKDEKKVDNWLYLINQRAKRDSIRKNHHNQGMHST